jgi:hypothetical protein
MWISIIVNLRRVIPSGDLARWETTIMMLIIIDVHLLRYCNRFIMQNKETNQEGDNSPAIITLAAQYISMLSVPDEVYSRNALYALSLISTFLFI